MPITMVVPIARQTAPARPESSRACHGVLLLDRKWPVAKIEVYESPGIGRVPRPAPQVLILVLVAVGFEDLLPALKWLRFGAGAAHLLTEPVRSNRGLHLAGRKGNRAQAHSSPAGPARARVRRVKHQLTCFLVVMGGHRVQPSLALAHV
jgi:hypothetical protein